MKAKKKSLSNLRFDQNRKLIATTETDQDQARLISATYTLNKNLTLAKMLLKETGLNFKTNIKITNRFLINNQLTDNFLMARVFKALRSQQKILKSKANSSCYLRVCDSSISASDVVNKININEKNVLDAGGMADTIHATDVHKNSPQKKLKNAIMSFWRHGNLLRLLDFNFLLLL